MELGSGEEAGLKLLFDTHTVTMAPQGRKEATRMPIDMNEDSITNLLDPAKSPSPAYINQRLAEGHYRIVSPALALVLVLTASCGVLYGQIRRSTWSRRTTISFCATMFFIGAVMSARSLVTAVPAAVPLLYASVTIPGIFMLTMLVLPSLNGFQTSREPRAGAFS